MKASRLAVMQARAVEAQAEKQAETATELAEIRSQLNRIEEMLQKMAAKKKPADGEKTAE